MKLLLVRHGEIPSNVKQIYAGTSSEKLTPRGVLQAEKVAAQLQSYEVHSLYSSPIERALQTAEVIGKKIGKKILIDRSFREMELGPWEGLSENDIARRYSKEWNIWQTRPAELQLPERETLDMLLERVLTGVCNIYGDCADCTAIIVTHVAIVRTLLLWHEKQSLNLYKTIHIPNAGIFEITVDTSPFR